MKNRSPVRTKPELALGEPLQTDVEFSPEAGAGLPPTVKTYARPQPKQPNRSNAAFPVCDFRKRAARRLLVVAENLDTPFEVGTVLDGNAGRHHVAEHVP